MRRQLRFSKSGEAQIEKHYSTHYVKVRIEAQPEQRSVAIAEEINVQG